jgi:hypothetical protein
VWSDFYLPIFQWDRCIEMASNTTQLSIGAFRDIQAQQRTLQANETTDAVLRLLAFAMRRTLAQYKALDPQHRLEIFLAHVPAQEVFRHRRPIRRGLKNAELADDLFITRGTLRVYRTRLYRFLDVLDQHFRPNKARSHPTLLPAWQAAVEALKRVDSASGMITAFKRLAVFCSEHDWVPDSLDEERIEAFRMGLETESGLQTHARYFRKAGKAWALLADAGRIACLAKTRRVIYAKCLSTMKRMQPRTIQTSARVFRHWPRVRWHSTWGRCLAFGAF